MEGERNGWMDGWMYRREEGRQAGSLDGKIAVPRRRIVKVRQITRDQFQEVGGFPQRTARQRRKSGLTRDACYLCPYLSACKTEALVSPERQGLSCWQLQALWGGAVGCRGTQQREPAGQYVALTSLGQWFRALLESNKLFLHSPLTSGMEPVLGFLEGFLEQRKSVREAGSPHLMTERKINPHSFCLCIWRPI